MPYRIFRYKSKFYGLLISAITAIIIALNLLSNHYLLSIPIYGFHGIYNRETPNHKKSSASYLDYSVKDINQLIIYLVENNYWFLSTQEFYDYFLVKSSPIPYGKRKAKPVMLTFDDGYKNIDLYLLPLLTEIQEKYNKPIKIVLFINPKFIEQNKQNQKIKYLQCQDLQKGVERGIYDVQSHGFSHRDLTKLDLNQLNYELQKSQTSLQTCLGKHNSVALHFAYPYDRVNSGVEVQTSKYYLSAFRFNSRFRKILFKKNNYTIPRIGVSQQDSLEKLIKFSL